jgi:hypothetical protein
MDLIFIDGGHRLETVWSDWLGVQPLLDENTLVRFDDYWNREQAGCKTLVDGTSPVRPAAPGKSTRDPRELFRRRRSRRGRAPGARLVRRTHQ